MDRFYYDHNPRTMHLISALMYFQFGMQFTDRLGNQLFWDGDANDFYTRADGRLYVGRYCVHPDSLPLLEVRPGDVVFNNCQGAYFWARDDYEERYGAVSVEHAQSWLSEKDARQENPCRIVERDGKPFHWPKREEPPE